MVEELDFYLLILPKFLLFHFYFLFVRSNVRRRRDWPGYWSIVTAGYIIITNTAKNAGKWSSCIFIVTSLNCIYTICFDLLCYHHQAELTAKLDRLEKRFEEQKLELALLKVKKREQKNVMYLTSRYRHNHEVIEELEREIAHLQAKISKRSKKSRNNLILQLPVRPIKHKNLDLAN